MLKLKVGNQIMLIKTKYKALFAGLFALAIAFPASALRYLNYDHADNTLIVVSDARPHSFINSGYVYRDCGSKEVCRYAKSQYVKDAKINKIWVYKKKNPYFSYDSAHSVIYENSKALNEKEVYCLSKGASYVSDDYKLLRFNRHIIGVEEATKRSGKILCRSMGVELPASIYGVAGDIMPLFFK